MNRYGSEAHFNGRVGVIIEVAPNRFVQYVMKEARGTIGIERDAEPAWDSLSAPIMLGPMFATMELSGRLVTQDEAERPAWMPAEPAAELEARRELGQR